jgi:hypothetical protein
MIGKIVWVLGSQKSWRCIRIDNGICTIEHEHRTGVEVKWVPRDDLTDDIRVGLGIAWVPPWADPNA